MRTRPETNQDEAVQLVTICAVCLAVLWAANQLATACGLHF